MIKVIYRMIGHALEQQLEKEFVSEESYKQWFDNNNNVVVVSKTYEGKAVASKLNSLFGL